MPTAPTYGVDVSRVGNGALVLPIAGAVTGYLLLAFVSVSDDQFTSTMVAEAGWTQIDGVSLVWSKISDGSETTVTFTCGGTGSGSRVFRGAVAMLATLSVASIASYDSGYLTNGGSTNALGQDYFPSVTTGMFVGFLSAKIGPLPATSLTVPADGVSCFSISDQLEGWWTIPIEDFTGSPTPLHVDLDVPIVSGDQYWLTATQVEFVPAPPDTGSSFELCVPVRDFPTSGTGTISGRPPLLCAVYEIAILDRLTQATIVRMPARGHTLTFGYRSGATSDASLVIDYGALSHGSISDQDCCARLGRVGEWMHELVIRREGNTEEIWGGPVTGVQDDPRNGTLTISAKDRSAWWWERFLPYDLIYQGNKQDAARVFIDLIRAADQPQSYLGRPNSGGQVLPHDPVGLIAFAYLTGVHVDAKVLLKADDVIIGDEIGSLTSAVIDWTVIGKRVYIGALVINLAPIPLLRQEHWVEVDPVVARNGIGVATKVVVRGSGSVRGEYPPGQIVTPRWPQYGSHGKKILDSTITDVGVATERARQEWERWQQPNFQVLTTNGTLGPKAPVTVEDLIPGRAMQVAITEGCMPTSLRLAEQRVGGRVQYYAYDSGQVQPLVVAQRLLQTDVTVVDSVEDEVKIDTQALGTEVRSRSAT